MNGLLPLCIFRSLLTSPPPLTSKYCHRPTHPADQFLPFNFAWMYHTSPMRSIVFRHLALFSSSRKGFQARYTVHYCTVLAATDFNWEFSWCLRKSLNNAWQRVLSHFTGDIIRLPFDLSAWSSLTAVRVFGKVLRLMRIPPVFEGKYQVSCYGLK